MSLGPRLLTIQEVAELLNVPERWVRDKVTERAIPFTKIGKHVRFTRDHIRQIVRHGEHEELIVVTDQAGHTQRVPRSEAATQDLDEPPIRRQSAPPRSRRRL
jgi:excisionase family DNA binding protein